MITGHFVGFFTADAARLPYDDAMAALQRARGTYLHGADLVELPGGRGALAVETIAGDAGVCRDVSVSTAGDGFAFVDGALDDHAAPSPAASILDAYRRLGPSSVNRLYGDLAVMAWHQGAPAFCAVSPGGARWLYYRYLEGTLWVADHPGLLLDSNRPRGDRVFFASQAQGCFSGQRTPFEDIHRLRPGYALCATAGQIVETRWWTPPRPGSHMAAPDAQRRELRQTLQAAVARHMRGHRRVCIALSGGVDSGAVAACARDVAQTTGTELLALTFATPEDALADEAPAAREAAARLGIAHRAVTVGDQGMEALLDAAGRLPFPTGHLIFSHPLAALARATQQWGATLLLNGAGGELHNGSFEYLFDLHRARRYARLLIEVATWRLQGYTLRRMGLEVVARARTAASTNGLSARPQPWLRLPPVEPAAEASTHPMLADLERFLTQEGTGLEMHRAIYARYGVEPAAPHLDRRVLELVLGLPLERRVSRRAGALNKPLLRSAFPEVSDEVCRRADRVNLGEYAARTWIGCAVDASLPSFLRRQSPLVDDVLDRKRLQGDLVRLRQSSGQTGLADVASAAIWLEAMDRLGVSLI